MKNQYLRLALLGFLTLFMVSARPERCQAQLSNFSSDAGNAQIQYSPDDPSTRSRLFNLQTGHAGAFYNCDSEEDKRNSPHICWNIGPGGEKFYNPFSVLCDWRRDKSEIAQRICDGAGACCNSGNCPVPGSVISAPAPCGCSECLAKAATPSAKLATKKVTLGLLGRAFVGKQAKPQVLAQENVAGLITNVAPSVVEQAQTPPQKETCNCAVCQAKRTNPATQSAKVATKAPSNKPVATTHSASLLDRARSSRNQQR